MSQQVNVLERYSEGAQAHQTELCCAVEYDSRLLQILPQEIIDKDYGCGDPSPYIREGDVVLDLGSGGGKICYIAAQLVGAQGRVIGVDMNDDMLALAQKYQAEMAKRLGGERVEFKKGLIQDLALDLAAVDAYLAANPVSKSRDLARLEAFKTQQRQETPLIPDSSVDLVISNCVLNLVEDGAKAQMVAEIFRVLRPGGRVAISDIISDEVVPQHLRDDPKLWSGCISGAFQEKEFLDAFLAMGFVAVSYDKWEAEPWQVVEGIEFRSATLTAVKPEGSECMDVGQAVIYKGPYTQVHDEEGHVFPRGERIAVCERTFRLLTTGPYNDDFIGISPAVSQEPVTWCAPAGTRRPAQETKGGIHQGGSCAESGCCS
ncbi:methyltransferase domain-containing protein [Nitrosococcus wardiae]|uniref:Arsenite methyltransferase n=1 Tax=Nitrosococcus wardiae TaxID=1814290 RepID=A0A4P7C0P5_9GAMM|nr:methyltransferase domain-containing protein [Nitrosococcus wardiae]QBQ56123.1 methyltransferase domain-containing protein [Nitrosococcus wardiae]